ncbi:unnamed protein product [Ixodes persulcatus]
MPNLPRVSLKKVLIKSKIIFKFEIFYICEKCFKAFGQIQGLCTRLLLETIPLGREERGKWIRDVWAVLAAQPAGTAQTLGTATLSSAIRIGCVPSIFYRLESVESDWFVICYRNAMYALSIFYPAESVEMPGYMYRGPSVARNGTS